ncbi:MAG: hypothetical protein PUG51_00155 [Firmicutes bacterium]|nr:hypothetical protein [Bacillota bacterium]
MSNFLGPFSVFNSAFGLVAINILAATIELCYEFGNNIVSAKLIPMNILLIMNVLMEILLKRGFKTDKYIITNKGTRIEGYTSYFIGVILISIANILISFFYIVDNYIKGFFPPYFVMMLFMISSMLGGIMLFHMINRRIQRPYYINNSNQ